MERRKVCRTNITLLEVARDTKFGPLREVIIARLAQASWSYCDSSLANMGDYQAAARALSDFAELSSGNPDGNTYYPAPRSDYSTSSSVQFTEKQRRRRSILNRLAYLGKDWSLSGLPDEAGSV